MTTYEQKFWDMVVIEEFGKPKNHIVEQGLMSFSNDTEKNKKVMEKLVHVYLGRSAMDQAPLESGILPLPEKLRYQSSVAATQPIYFFPMVTHWALQNRGLLARESKVYGEPTMCEDPAMAEIKARFGLDKIPCQIPKARPNWLTGAMLQ